MAGYTFRYGSGGEKGRITAVYKEMREPAARISFRYTAVNHGRIQIQYQKMIRPCPIKYGFVYTAANTFHFTYPAESGRMSYGLRYCFRVGVLPVRCYRFQYGQGYGRLYIEKSAIEFMQPYRKSIRVLMAIAFPLLARQVILALKDILIPEQMREIGERIRTIDFPILRRETGTADGTVDFSFLIREIASAEDTKDFSLLIREIATAEKLQDFSLLIREIAEVEKTQDFSFLIREIARAETTEDFSFLVREIAETMQTIDFSFVIREIADTVHSLDFSFLIREIASAEKTEDFSFLVREIAAAEKTKDFSFLIRELASAERTRDFSFLIREIARAETTKDFSFLIREIADAVRTQDFSFLIREIASAIGTLDFSFIIRQLSRPEVTENFSFLIREIAKAEDTQSFSFLIREAADAANVLAFAFIIREVLKEEHSRDFVMTDREGTAGHEQLGRVKHHSVYEQVLELPAQRLNKTVQKEPEEQQMDRIIWKAGTITVMEQLTAILRKAEQIWIEEDSRTQQKEKKAEREQSVSVEQKHDMAAAAFIKDLKPQERHGDITEFVQLDAEKESILSDSLSLDTLPEWLEPSESILTELLQKRIALLPGLLQAVKRQKETTIDDGVQLERPVPVRNGHQEQSEQLIEKSEKYSQMADSRELQKAQDGGQEELEQVWEKKEKEHQAGIRTMGLEKLPDTAQNEDAEQVLEKTEKEGVTEQSEQQSFPDHETIKEGTAEPLMRKEHESKRAAEEQGKRTVQRDSLEESKEAAGAKQISRDGKQEESQRLPVKKQPVKDALTEGNENETILHRLQEALTEAIEDKSLLSREQEGITEEVTVSGGEEKAAAILQGILLDYPELVPILSAMQAYAEEKQGIKEAVQIALKRLVELDIQEVERALQLYQRFWVIGQSEYKDWLILPPHDFDYENEPVTFDVPEQEDYNQYVYPNEFYRRIDRHPIQSGKDMGREEIGVSVGILVDLINIYVLMWFKFTQAFWGWTGVEAVTGIVDAVHEYLTLETTIRKQNQKDVLEEYERAFQWLRWHGEQVVLSAREDRNLRGNYYVEVLLEQLIHDMIDHHFDVMPIFRDVNKMDEWRTLFDRKEEKDIKWVTDKVKGLRHKLLETKQYEEE